ncbi:MAG TPA: RsmG family class I SAM-dependent methyltransferase [Acidimicrobiales bacterium]|nr:RsmG family class I SAM-dependent methyltransferase [Acidimicrobiales bacterium]
MAERRPTTPEDPEGLPEALLTALGQAQDLGFFGDGPLAEPIAHARGFAVSLREAAPGAASLTVGGTQSGRSEQWAAWAEQWAAWASHGPPSFLDLGSGGGLPGLVLAAEWPSSAVVLLDAHGRRAEALRRAVEACGWQDRVEVVHDRAERAGRLPELRGSQALVVARSFGPPALVAECSSPFLRDGGLLMVSEPPLHQPQGQPPSPGSGPSQAVVGHPQRWPADQLEQLGLVPWRFVTREFGYQILVQAGSCPDRFPRREGVPAKRPLY